MLPTILEGKKIFIIEDDPMSLSLISSCLLKHGARIEANALGFDIIDHLVESMPVDLIILDVNLRKNLPGYQVLENIRSMPSLYQVPVVMVTATDWEIALPKARAAGANG
ncbi:MAG TPA: response regulator, partial [Anaerolineales bacterium]|nr:response regulator [Anaerolineales bacterium]HNC91005.1 response regulator [Anaerolineales bacterium]